MSKKEAKKISEKVNVVVYQQQVKTAKRKL